MYDNKLQETIIDSLESKTIELVNASIVLASQGYLVNKTKRAKLEWSSILIHAFENIDVFSDEQKNQIEVVYKKLQTI